VLFRSFTLSLLTYSIVCGHSAQIVPRNKISAGPGFSDKDIGSGGNHRKFLVLGNVKDKRGYQPLGDWRPPKRFIGLREKEAYELMRSENKTVKDLFEEVAGGAGPIVKFDPVVDPLGYKPGTCGYWDPKFQVQLTPDADVAMRVFGGNHDGPAETWIDGVLTDHISNVAFANPYVTPRSAFNCDKATCEYRWYWIAFRSDQLRKGPTFQMWVQCATIVGNGMKAPAVVPTNKWLNDSRGINFIGERSEQDPNAPVTVNPSQKLATEGSPTEVSPPKPKLLPAPLLTPQEPPNICAEMRKLLDNMCPV